MNYHKNTTPEKLIQYWSQPYIKSWMGKLGIRYQFPSSNTKSCMACGYLEKVERAHIVPSSWGGGDECSNVHLLCPNCHKESEGLGRNGRSLIYYKWMAWVNRQRYRHWSEWMYEWYLKLADYTDEYSDYEGDDSLRMFVSKKVLKLPDSEDVGWSQVVNEASLNEVVRVLSAERERAASLALGAPEEVAV